jgi:DNA-binding MarR family transcriptional regulator
MSSKPAPQPLSPSQERTWRALIRLMVQMPRAIDDDLSRRAGLSLTRYIVLMRLSEVPDRALRMSDLAEAASMSPSRMTRIIQSMITEGLVTRQVVPGDRRASLATLTDAGLQRLQEAWPAHLAGVRALVMDHIDPADRADFNRVTERLLRAVENAPDRTKEARPTKDPGGSEHIAE